MSGDELNRFLESGILEMYVMGQTTPDECRHVEDMALQFDEVKAALDILASALEQYSLQHAIAPDPTIKPFLMATIDYMERMEQGEEPSSPPVLNEQSKIEDFEPWINRRDFELKTPFKDIQAKIISYTPQMTTAVVWLEHGAPPETHTNELEKFLIIEGTCNIIVDGKDNHLKPGDIFNIPLHLSHTVLVTSSIACKIILQRVAA
jgi:mannose-6-phosphate isomerase-like protein (cupin superfamily)